MPRRLRLSGNLILLLAKDYDRMAAELARLRELERSYHLGHLPRAPLARAVREIERAKTEEIP